MPAFETYDNNVINNRIQAYHFGVIIEPKENLNIRGMFTYSQNYGTYAGLYEGRFSWSGAAIDPDFEYVFKDGKDQFYSLIQAKFRTTVLGQAANLNALMAFDTGELYTNLGVEIGLEFILE